MGLRPQPRPLELDVAARAVAIDNLAEKNGTSVAELRHESAELVAGISHGECFAALRHPVARERISTPSGAASFPASSPRCRARPSFSLTRRGAATGVGKSRAKNRSGRRA